MAINKRVRKDGTVAWQVVIDEPSFGKRKRHVIGTYSTKKLAQKAEREAVTAVEERQFVQRSRITIAELLNLYLDSADGRLKESTVATYRHIITKHLIPDIGTMVAQSLDTHTLQSLVNEWKSTKTTRTIQECVMRLSGAFNHGIKLNIVAANPCAHVMVPKSKRKDVPIWSEAELARFLTVGDTWQYGILWRLLIETGMRRGEALALAWQDVDTVSKEIRVQESKTDAGRRVIMISDDLAARLQSHHKKNIASTLVLESRNGTPLQPTMIRLALDRQCKKAGVPRVHVHGLRHLAATRMLRAKVAEGVAQKRMGHGSSEMLRRIYQHADADMQRDAVTALATLGAAVMRSSDEDSTGMMGSDAVKVESD